MQRAWVTHHHCPLALLRSVMGGAGMNVNQKKTKMKANNGTNYVVSQAEAPADDGVADEIPRLAKPQSEAEEAQPMEEGAEAEELSAAAEASETEEQ